MMKIQIISYQTDSVFASSVSGSFPQKHWAQQILSSLVTVSTCACLCCLDWMWVWIDSVCVWVRWYDKERCVCVSTDLSFLQPNKIRRINWHPWDHWNSPWAGFAFTLLTMLGKIKKLSKLFWKPSFIIPHYLKVFVICILGCFQLRFLD